MKMHKVLHLEKKNVLSKEEQQVVKVPVKACNNRKTDRNILNRKCEFATAEEEIKDRHEVAAETLKVYRRYLHGYPSRK